MDDFISISLLSVSMLVGCYVAGTIPLAVNFSEVSYYYIDWVQLKANYLRNRTFKKLCICLLCSVKIGT